MKRFGKQRLALLLALVCILMTACKKTTPETTPTPPAETATAAVTPTATPEPTETPAPEPTPTPESNAIHYEMTGTNEEGEGYVFSAEFPRFGAEEVDGYFENRIARLRSGFLAELDSGDADEGASFELTCAVPYHRNGVVSVVFEKYTYLGGAYPNLAYECATIDMEQNVRLLLGDVVSDLETLKALAWKFFPEELAGAVDPDAAPEQIGRSLDEELFSLGEEALSLYFPDYAFGYRNWTEVQIPYEAFRAAGVLADWVTA